MFTAADEPSRGDCCLVRVQGKRVGLPLDGGARGGAVFPQGLAALRRNTRAQPGGRSVGAGRFAVLARPGSSLDVCLALCDVERWLTVPPRHHHTIC